MKRPLTVAATAGVLTFAGATVAYACVTPPLVDHVDHVRIQVERVGEVTQERIFPTDAGRDNATYSNRDVWLAAKALDPYLGGDNEYVQFVCYRWQHASGSWDVEPGRVALGFWELVDRGCDNPVWYPDATTR